MSKSFNNILLTRTDRIGDVILSLPVAPAIKQEWPDARVTFLVRQAAVPVVRMCPWIDDVITLLEDTDTTGQAAELESRCFDAAVCLYPRADIASLLRAARIPVRVGTARRFFSLKFNKRINISRSAGGRHERDFNLDLLRGLGLDQPVVVDPRCIPTSEARDKARIMLGEMGISPARHPFIVVHPGCGGSARNWVPQRYGELCRFLNREGAIVLVSGSSAETDLTESIATAGGEGVRDLHGRADLPTLAAILEMAAVFVGPSTGPMHLAAAVGTPVVALFGPVRTTGPDRWGPLGAGHRVCETGVPACRCRVDQCKLRDCMDRIRVEDVAGAALDALKRSSQAKLLHS